MAAGKQASSCILAICLGLAATSGAGAWPGGGAVPPVVLAKGGGVEAFERSWDGQTRRAVQEALVWTGDYDTRVDGAIGPRTRSAIRDFQRDHGWRATGHLTREQFDALMAARRAAVEEVGFRVVDHAETGVRVGIPLRLLERSHREETSVVYRSRDGSEITSLALISMPGESWRLPRLFEVLSAPRVVEDDAYTLLKDDYFVISDKKNGIVTYTYVEAAGGALKGFALAWPAERMDRFAPIATAMFNSFEPIPGVLD